MADTIDIRPNWRTSIEIIIAALENGTEEGKRVARAELRELAAKLDAPCNTAPTPPDVNLSSFDFELIADALDVLDPDGSEQTARKQELEAWARQMGATGRGYLPHGAKRLALDVLAIARDDDGDAMLDGEGLSELQSHARQLAAIA